MNKLYNYFKKIYEENKIVQAYLIGNTSYRIIENSLNEVLKKYFFKDDNVSNLDIQLLKNDEGIISKEDIKKMLDNISRTSQFNGIKVYIIDGCEKLNDFAYNAILKTLEEPQKNIYAFLITKNMDAVRATISSRCQKIFISNNENNIEEEYEDIALKMMNEIENRKLDFISSNYKYYNEIEDRNTFSKILEIIIKKYNNKLLEEVSNKDASNDEIKKIGKKILAINEINALLENNVNKNLCLDKLIIEMWRCNNEDSWN